MSNKNKKTLEERLSTLVDFDASKRLTPGQNAFKEAVDEIQKERIEKTKEIAKNLLNEALDLNDKKIAAKRQFESEIKKFDKKLGKLLNKIESMVAGRPYKEDEENDSGKEE